MTTTRIRTLAMLLLCAAVSGAQTTWHVDAAATSPGTGAGAAPFRTIQEGIVAAQTSDTVLVRPGQYGELIDFLGKTIRVTSVAGRGATAIDGGRSGSVVTIDQGEGSGTELSGFTIHNGQALRGGGLRIGSMSAPLIKNCRITGCTAESGGGVHVDDATPTFERCVIEGNTANGPGGGVYATNHGRSRFVSCTIRGNTTPYAGGGIAAQVFAAVVLESTLVADNAVPTGHGGGVAIEKYGTLEVTHSTLAGNHAGTAGGALRTTNGGRLTNGILWGNTADQIDREGGPATVIRHANIQGGFSGTAITNVDPSFRAPLSGDYHLHWTSPCVDAADPTAPLPALDLDGEPRTIRGLPDLGADEANPLLLDVTAPFGPGSLEVRTIAFTHPFAVAFSVFTTHPTNATSLGSGPWMGLHITSPEVVSQFLANVPPFLHTLDAQGLASWTAPAGTMAGLSGLTAYGVTVFVDLSTGQLLAQSEPIAFTFP
jgi:hypothetical protein